MELLTEENEKEIRPLGNYAHRSFSAMWLAGISVKLALHAAKTLQKYQLQNTPR